MINNYPNLVIIPLQILSHYTVELQFKESLYDKVLGLTNNILCPSGSRIPVSTI